MLSASLFASCLVTSSPTFDEPTSLAPQIVADRVEPDQLGVVVLDPSTPSKTFSAFVRGEDAGRPVEVRLLLDYGWPNDLGRPFRLSSAGPSVEAASGDDDPRPIKVTWTQGTLPMQPGCHRLTLMVSHEFDDGGTGCPVSADDYDLVSWLVLKCDALGCPELDLSRTKQSDDDLACPPVAATCSDGAAGLGGSTP
jgi:hypothetical protein